MENIKGSHAVGVALIANEIRHAIEQITGRCLPGRSTLWQDIAVCCQHFGEAVGHELVCKVVDDQPLVALKAPRAFRMLKALAHIESSEPGLSPLIVFKRHFDKGILVFLPPADWREREPPPMPNSDLAVPM